jgi:hypothetical protein
LPRFARFARTFKGRLVGTADHFALQKRQPFARRHNACKILKQMRAAGSSRKPCEQKEKRTTRVRFSFWLV